MGFGYRVSGRAVAACCLLLAVCSFAIAACSVSQRDVRVAGVAEFQVSGYARDSYDTGAANNPYAANVRMGQGASSDNTAGYQFSSFTVPRDSTIVTAALSANIQATQGSDWSLRVYGEASDSCANFTTSWPASRTLTAANVTWSIPAGTGWKISADIAPVIQEVITRSSWSSGNNLCLIVKDNQTTANTYQDAYSYDADTGKAAKLSLNYSTATPTATPTSTNTPTPTPTPTPTWPCGQILADATWSGTYTVTCNIAVPRGVTLTIAPGTTVKTNGLYKWDVYGALNAVGLPTSTITLTSGISTARGSWGPLFVLGAATMDYVTMTFGAALEIAAPATITHALFMSNTVGVDFLYPGRIVSSTIRNSTVGILVRQNVSPMIQATNILTASDVALWNAQALTLTVPGLWWGSAVTTTIEAAIRDQYDDYRLGPVQWQPAASAAW
jgi:hypothetical protein